MFKPDNAFTRMIDSQFSAIRDALAVEATEDTLNGLRGLLLPGPNVHRQTVDPRILSLVQRLQEQAVEAYKEANAAPPITHAATRALDPEPSGVIKPMPPEYLALFNAARTMLQNWDNWTTAPGSITLSELGPRLHQFMLPLYAAVGLKPPPGEPAWTLYKRDALGGAPEPEPTPFLKTPTPVWTAAVEVCERWESCESRPMHLVRAWVDVSAAVRKLQVSLGRPPHPKPIGWTQEAPHE